MPRRGIETDTGLRPCHNLVRDCENSGQLFPACSLALFSAPLLLEPRTSRSVPVGTPVPVCHGGRENTNGEVDWNSACKGPLEVCPVSSGFETHANKLRSRLISFFQPQG